MVSKSDLLESNYHSCHYSYKRTYPPSELSKYVTSIDRFAKAEEHKYWGFSCYYSIDMVWRVQLSVNVS
jgi:hypothetical protein